MCSCCVFDSPRLLTFPLLAVCLLSYRPVFSSWPSASSSTMWWTIPCALPLWGPWHPCRVRPSHIEKVLFKTVGKKFRIESVCSLTKKKGLFFSVYVDDRKFAGKKQNINPTWKIFMKDIDLGEPTSCLDHVYLGCTQRECQISKILDNYKSIIESRNSAGTMENYQEQKPQENLTPTLSLHGPMTWKAMQRSAWKDIANWQIKQFKNYTKSRRHVWMTTH